MNSSDTLTTHIRLRKLPKLFQTLYSDILPDLTQYYYMITHAFAIFTNIQNTKLIETIVM